MDIGNLLTGIPENSYQKRMHRFKPDGIPALRGGGRNRFLPLTKKLSANDALLKREN